MLTAPEEVKLSGYTSLDGNDWVYAGTSSRHAWLRYALFAGNSQAAIKALADDGIVIVGGAKLSRFRDAIQNLTFEPAALLERPGWTGRYFALGDGFVASPKGHPVGIPVFPLNTRQNGASGGARAWRFEVAEPLATNALASFMIALTLSGSLLELAGFEESPIHELTGLNARGKSRMQRIMASVVGPCTRPSARYQTSLNTTVAGLEDVVPQHRDGPLILDDENRLQIGQKVDPRAHLIWLLSSPEGKKRFEKKRVDAGLCCSVISSNQPALESTNGRAAGYVGATSDRLISHAIAPEGIFYPAPPNFAGAGEFADHLGEKVQNLYGTCYRRFLKKLVNCNASNPEALRTRFQADLAEFRAAVGVTVSEGSARRIADMFGIAYAAGRLGVEFRALPKSFDPMWSAKTCYDRYIVRRPEVSAERKLAAFARRGDVLKWDKHGESLRPRKDRQYVASVRTSRCGERELRIPTAVFAAEFEEPSKMLRAAKRAGMLRPAKDGFRTKRKVTPHREQEVCYVFVRPASKKGT